MIAALLYESKIRAVSFIFNFVRMKKKAGVLGLKVKGDRMDICDTFLKRGKELNAFTQLVEELAEHTYVIDMETDQIELLPVLDVKQLKKTFSSSGKNGISGMEESGFPKGKVIYMGTIRDYFSRSLPTLQTLSLEEIQGKGGSEEIFLEAQNQSRLFIRYNGQMYFTSPRLPESLCARAKMYGDAVFDQSVEWATFVMHRLHSAPQSVKALIRELPQSGIRKIVMMGSAHYKYIPQSFFRNTIHMLEKLVGEPPCSRSWQVDAFVSTVYLEFPELGQRLRERYQICEELIPGIRLSTSDTYDASLSARPTWRLENAVAEGEGVLIKHDGKASVNSLHIGIKTEIMEQYPVFLERMKHFQEVNVINPESVLSHLFSQLKIMKAIGKKRTIRLLPETAAQIQNSYSAYDLNLNLMKLTEDCTLPESPAQKLKRAVYDAVFLEDKHYQRKTGGANPPALKQGGQL